MSEQISDAEALLSLEKDGTAIRSKIGRLRSVFTEIEELQVKGFSNQAIVDKLNTLGYELTLKTFETMLYRIRKDAGTTKRASLAAVVTVGKAMPVQAVEAGNLDCAIQNEQGEGMKSDELADLPIMERVRQVTSPEAVDKKFEDYSNKSKRVNPLK